MNKKYLFAFLWIAVGLIMILFFIFKVLSISHIVQILIAIGALVTAYYARKSFELTNKIFKKERLSKRGLMAQAEKLGSLAGDNKQLKINYKNYGSNAVKDVIVNILIYKKDTIFEAGKKQLPVINTDAFCGNLLPPNEIYYITLDFQNPLQNPVNTAYFVIAKIKYYDVALDCTFDNEFSFWQLDGRNSLDEIEPKHKNSIKDVLKFDKDFWTFIDEDFNKRVKILN